MPWLVWLSWLERRLVHQRVGVWFPVGAWFPEGAHAWVAGLIPGWGTNGRQPIDVFLSL